MPRSEVAIAALLLTSCLRGAPITEAPSAAEADADADADTDADTDTDTDNDQDGDGWSAESDCNDNDKSINPGADEVCGDGLDNDCSGEATACEWAGTQSSGSAAALVLTGGSGEQTGISVAIVGDADGSGSSGLLVGAPEANDQTGTAYLFELPGTGTLPTSGADVIFNGTELKDGLGRHVVSLGDIDKVAGDEIAFIAPGASTGSAAGGIYVIPGPVLSADMDDATLLYGSTTDESSFTGSIHSDDVTGDGVPDLLIGDIYQNRRQGAVLVYSGDGLFDTFTGTEMCIQGLASRAALFGSGITTLKMSGSTGLIISAYRADDPSGSEEDNGGVFLLENPSNGTSSVEDADLAIYGDDANENFGYSMSSVGDLDGDGHDELAVSAFAHEDQSALLVFSGDTLSTCLLAAGCTLLSSTDAEWRFVTSDTLHSFDELAGETDLNGDGQADLIANMGSTAAGATTGRVFVSYGPLPAGGGGLFELSTTASSVDAVFTESGSGGYFGAAVTTGDTNDDGKDDLLIGAYESGGGAAYLILGQGL